MTGALYPRRSTLWHAPLPASPLRYSQAPSGCGYPVFNRYYETAKTAAFAWPLASVSLARGCPHFFQGFARPARGKIEHGARTLVNRCHPNPVVCGGRGTALPAFQDTPICLCPALRSRSGLLALGLRPMAVTTYCVQGDAVPPCSNRRTQTVSQFSEFNDAALALAPYASCTPYGRATQCSLPSGCQPFSGGSVSPLGITNMFHVVCFIIHYSSCFGCWRDEHAGLPIQLPAFDQHRPTKNCEEPDSFR